MARGVNKVIIVGNCGKDPEVRYMPNGGAVCSITVATSESWKDKNTGQKMERTEWHQVEAFNRLAEIMGEYLRKGSQVYIEGSLRTDKYQDKTTGQDRYSTKIIARDMQMLGVKGDQGGDNFGGGQQGGGFNQGGQGGPANQGGGFNQGGDQGAGGGGQQQGGFTQGGQQGGAQPQQTQQQAPAGDYRDGGHFQGQPKPQQQQGDNGPVSDGFDDFDDDIPF